MLWLCLLELMIEVDDGTRYDGISNTLEPWWKPMSTYCRFGSFYDADDKFAARLKVD